MKKIKIKTSPAKVDVNTATSILNKDVLQAQIADAKEANELIKPGAYLSFLKQEFDKADKAFKKAVKVEADKAKVIKEEIADLETKLKAKALKVVKVTETQKVNQATGEVKRKLEHNLETKLFSYTPGKKGAVIDTKVLLDNPDKYKRFLKPITTYEVNFEEVNKAKAEELPWTEVETPDKISFKKVDRETGEVLVKRQNERERDAKLQNN